MQPLSRRLPVFWRTLAIGLAALTCYPNTLPASGISSQKCLFILEYAEKDVVVSDFPLVAVVDQKPNFQSRNFTLSTRGKINLIGNTQKANISPQSVAVLGSGLTLKKGSDGKLADLAVSMRSGGRISVDLDVKQSYIKIKYIIDF